MSAPAIELKGVTKSVQDGPQRRVLLDKVELRLPLGKTTLFEGPNGSAKSTLAQIVAGYDDDFEGEVLVEGRPLRRGEVGFAYQQAALSLFGWEDPLANLIEPCRIAGMSLADAKRRAFELAERFGWEGLLENEGAWWRRLGRRADSMSGGEKQKLNLLRAIIHQPRLIVLDEPFNNVDREGVTEVLSFLRSLGEGEGKEPPALLLIAHDETGQLRALADYRLAFGACPNRFTIDNLEPTP